ncbi:MAG TPA: hypothetical protein VK163_00025 [Opitutaceae bacterium]|nr:hypothetical protein [Opitutaceae bacterium]
MALLDIDSLTPGMKVGKDVVEASGQVLLRAGTEISEKHLRVLRSWGIQQVEIEGPKPPDSEDTFLSRASPELLDRAQASVNERFRHTDPVHPAIAELMRLAVVAELRHLVPAAPPPPPAA